jgi:hypothetical protein
MQQQVEIIQGDSQQLDLLRDYRVVHQGRFDGLEAVVERDGSVTFIAPLQDSKKCAVAASIVVSRRTLLAVLGMADSAG